MSHASRPRRREGVLAQTTADTTIILDPESGAYFTLDEVGSFVWDLCDGTRTLEEIASAICSEYDVSEATARQDVTDLVGQLETERLLDATA
jgi:hypothetical protein